MKHILAATISSIAACLTLSVSAAPTSPDRTEVAFVANAEAGTVALVDVASRSIIGVLDINPERAERKGPGATNYAQDTDVSPDGRTINVSRGYLGDVVTYDLASKQFNAEGPHDRKNRALSLRRRPLSPFRRATRYQSLLVP